MRTQVTRRQIWFAVLVAVVVGACSAPPSEPEAAGPALASTSTAPERERAALQAPSVSGDTLYYDDLFDTDTVLWFWAPW